MQSVFCRPVPVLHSRVIVTEQPPVCITRFAGHGYCLPNRIPGGRGMGGVLCRKRGQDAGDSGSRGGGGGGGGCYLILTSCSQPQSLPDNQRLP